MGPTVCLRPIDMVSRLINCQHSCNRPDSGVSSTPPGKRIAESVKRFGFPGPHYPHVIPSEAGNANGPQAPVCLRTMRLKWCSHLGQLHHFEASASHVVLPGGVMACQLCLVSMRSGTSRGGPPLAAALGGSSAIRFRFPSVIDAFL